MTYAIVTPVAEQHGFEYQDINNSTSALVTHEISTVPTKIT